MAGPDKSGWENIASLPRRITERVVTDVRHDMRGTKQKAADILPPALLFAIEKWLAFWFVLIGTALLIGGLGMGLVSVAEWASTVPVLTSTVPWAIGHVWLLGLLTVLTWGVILFALVAVSVVRLALWFRTVTTAFWSRHTPPFTPAEDDSAADSRAWPPSDAQLDRARDEMWDFLGKGSIAFVAVVFLLFAAETLASSILYGLLSSEHLMAVGDSLDAGVGVVDFGGLLAAVAPSVDQPQLIFIILFFGLPGTLMAIGARNLLFLAESHIRERIETVREDGPIGWAGLFLLVVLVYSTGVCIQLIAEFF